VLIKNIDFSIHITKMSENLLQDAQYQLHVLAL